MDRPNLRPVPSRPSGPVDPADARRHVAADLPALDDPAVAALALVDLAGLTRAEAAAASELAPEDLRLALARGRTALRRAFHPLPGSGWCSRAEELLSDRLDGVIDERGARLLDVHLDNCPRCVEHDRRLAQAQDGLVGRFTAAHGGSAESEPAPLAAPQLHVVEEAPALPPAAEPEAPAAQAPASTPLMSSVSEAGGRMWVSAAGMAVALTMLSILIVILGALGASIHF